MFQWICPECGRRCLPSSRECPICSASETAEQEEASSSAVAALAIQADSVSTSSPVAVLAPEVKAPDVPVYNGGVQANGDIAGNGITHHDVPAEVDTPGPAAQALVEPAPLKPASAPKSNSGVVWQRWGGRPAISGVSQFSRPTPAVEPEPAPQVKQAMWSDEVEPVPAPEPPAGEIHDRATEEIPLPLPEYFAFTEPPTVVPETDQNAVTAEMPFPVDLQLPLVEHAVETMQEPAPDVPIELLEPLDDVIEQPLAEPILEPEALIPLPLVEHAEVTPELPLSPEVETASAPSEPLALIEEPFEALPEIRTEVASTDIPPFQAHFDTAARVATLAPVAAEPLEARPHIHIEAAESAPPEPVAEVAAVPFFAAPQEATPEIHTEAEEAAVPVFVEHFVSPDVAEPAVSESAAATAVTETAVAESAAEHALAFEHPFEHPVEHEIPVSNPEEPVTEAVAEASSAIHTEAEEAAVPPFVAHTEPATHDEPIINPVEPPVAYHFTPSVAEHAAEVAIPEGVAGIQTDPAPVDQAILPAIVEIHTQPLVQESLPPAPDEPLEIHTQPAVHEIFTPIQHEPQEIAAEALPQITPEVHPEPLAEVAPAVAKRLHEFLAAHPEPIVEVQLEPLPVDTVSSSPEEPPVAETAADLVGAGMGAMALSHPPSDPPIATAVPEALPEAVPEPVLEAARESVAQIADEPIPENVPGIQPRWPELRFKAHAPLTSSLAPMTGPQLTLPSPALPPELERFQDGYVITPGAEMRKRKNPAAGWLPYIAVTALVAAIFFGFVFYLLPRLMGGGESQNNVEGPSIPQVVTAATTDTHPLAKYIELTGIRLAVDANRKPEIHYLVVNHSTAMIADVTMNVTIRSVNRRATDAPITKFSFKLSSLGPWEAKEFTSEIETNLKSYELPDWRNIRADYQIVAP